MLEETITKIIEEIKIAWELLFTIYLKQAKFMFVKDLGITFFGLVLLISSITLLVRCIKAGILEEKDKESAKEKYPFILSGDDSFFFVMIASIVFTIVGFTIVSTNMWQALNFTMNPEYMALKLLLAEIK